MTRKEQFEIIGKPIEMKDFRKGDILLLNSDFDEEDISYVGIFSHFIKDEIWCNFLVPSYDNTFTKEDIPEHEEFFKEPMKRLDKEDLINVILLRRK